MTRKDYPLIARALKAAKRPLCPGWSLNDCLRVDQGWRSAIMHVAEALKIDSPAFDRTRFLVDCGLPHVPNYFELPLSEDKHEVTCADGSTELVDSEELEAAGDIFERIYGKQP